MSRQSLARPGVFLSRHNVFMSQQSWKWWRGFVSQQNILCRDRVGHDRKLCRTQQSWAYKASVHDSVAPCCVVTEEARRSRQTLGAQDRGVRVRQRNSVAIDLYNDEKKKTLGFGVSQQEFKLVPKMVAVAKVVVVKVVVVMELDMAERRQ